MESLLIMWLAQNLSNACTLFTHKPLKKKTTYQRDNSQSLSNHMYIGDYVFGHGMSEEPIEVVVINLSVYRNMQDTIRTLRTENEMLRNSLENPLIYSMSGGSNEDINQTGNGHG